MTQPIFLDRDDVAELEPHEGDERHSRWLSPYAIPRAVTVRSLTPDRTVVVEFDYYGEEAGEPSVELLDDGAEPAVAVRVSAYTQKVISVKIAAPEPLDLAAVGDRLEAVSGSFPGPAKRLSYRMTAAVLRRIAPHFRVAGLSPQP